MLSVENCTTFPLWLFASSDNLSTNARSKRRARSICEPHAWEIWSLNLHKIHVFKDLVMSKRLRPPFFWSLLVMNIVHILVKSDIKLFTAFALSKLCNLFLKLRWKKTKDMILCLHVNYIVFCMKGSFTVTLSPNSNFVVDHNVSSMYCWSSSGKYVNLQVIRSIHKCYIFKTDRRAKSHDFVVSLTISRPISCSHMLATNFSRFLAKSNSKNILELQSWFSR